MKQKKTGCVLFSGNEKPLSRFAEACFIFSPRIALRGEEALFLEIVDETKTKLGLFDLASQFGLPQPQWGEGSSPTEALVRAKFPKHQNILTAPLDALSCFLSPFFMDEAIERKTLHWISLFHQLGVSTIQQFLALPRSQLTERFGKDVLLKDTPWPVFQMTESISEISPVDSSTELEPLIFILKAICDRLCSRLVGRSQKATAIEIILTLDFLKKKNKKLSLRLAYPQSTTTGLLVILRERLGHWFQSEPLGAPVIEVEVAVTEMIAWNGCQKNFFDKAEEHAESCEEFLGAVSSLVGSENIFFAQYANRYLPESAWKKSFSNAHPTESVKPHLPSRPSRVIRNPIPVSVNELRDWKVRQVSGPERISGEWWQDPQYKGFDRDYYKLFTESGEGLWIYKDRLQEERLYLHGYFD